MLTHGVMCPFWWRADWERQPEHLLEAVALCGCALSYSKDRHNRDLEMHKFSKGMDHHSKSQDHVVLVAVVTGALVIHAYSSDCVPNGSAPVRFA